MKSFSLKSLIRIGVLFSLLALLPFNFAQGAIIVKTTKGGDSLTTSGFSGIINVASAQTIKNGLAVSLLTSSNFSETALMPRFGFGLLECLEIAIGVDIPLNRSAFLAGTTGVKWKFWNNENIQLAASGNIQINGKDGGTNIDGQILIHASWNLNENFQTSAVFGKTLGQTSTTLADWDFGMGVQWWLLSQQIFQLALAVDFTNYDYRAYMPGIAAGGAYRRGNVSAAARFGFMDKVIMFDIGATNLLDSNIALYASVASSFNF